jgi:Peptide-N-glycosidase F, C terminal/Peptide-N-glycosidase F, N terminal
MNRAAPLLFAFIFSGAAIVACGVTGAGEGSDDAGAPDEASLVGRDAATHVADATAPEDAGAGKGGDASHAVDATPPPPTPGADASVTAFDQTLVCFGSGGTGPCSRTVDAQVTFPTTGTYSRIVLHVTLDCPSNGCDPWDRVGSIDLVTTPEGPDAGVETLTELGRFITPYNIVSGVNSPPEWDIDVTELRPLLSGTVILRAFIDTWVPQGNASAYGGGWVVGATFDMTGGTPAKEPIAVVPIWTWRTTGKEPTQIVYGDPTNPISSSLPTQTVPLPAGATSYGIRSTITGHGQANLDNCAEFCSEDHTWKVGTTANTAAMWRTDCANFPSSGTYQYSRAGWCPGADVAPWDIDVTSQVGDGGTIPVSYAVTPYVNTCNGTTCSGCASGESCTYDGSDHTQPFYYVQALLIGFR